MPRHSSLSRGCAMPAPKPTASRPSAPRIISMSCGGGSFRVWIIPCCVYGQRFTPLHACICNLFTPQDSQPLWPLVLLVAVSEPYTATRWGRVQQCQSYMQYASAMTASSGDHSSNVLAHCSALGVSMTCMRAWAGKGEQRDRRVLQASSQLANSTLMRNMHASI
jgi:hypothetical protein